MNAQDGLLYLTGVLSNTNKIQAVHCIPTQLGSPRIARRQQAIMLVAKNDEIIKDKKVRLFMQFIQDLVKVDLSGLQEIKHWDPGNEGMGGGELKRRRQGYKCTGSRCLRGLYGT